MPFFQCSLATSGRCVVNNLFIYSSRTRYSHLLSACWSWRCNSASNEKGLKNAFRIEHSMWEGPKLPCGLTSAYYKMWVGLNGFNPRNDLVLGSVRIGMDCMNLVTVILRYMRVPVTLRLHKHRDNAQYKTRKQWQIAQHKWGEGSQIRSWAMFMTAKSRTTNKKRVLHKGTVQRISVCCSFKIVRVGMFQRVQLKQMWLKVMEDPSKKCLLSFTAGKMNNLFTWSMYTRTSRVAKGQPCPISSGLYPDELHCHFEINELAVTLLST